MTMQFSVSGEGSRAELDALAARGIVPVGHNVQWEIVGPLEYERVQDAFALQFGWEDVGRACYAPFRVTPAKALERALAALPGYRSVRVPGHKGRFSLLEVPPDHEKRSVKPRVVLDAEASYALDGSGALVLECTDPDWESDLYARTLRQYDALWAEDVGRAFSERLMPAAQGVPLRSRGGQWFLPWVRNDWLLKMEAVVQHFGNDSFLLMTGIIDAAVYTSSIGKVVHMELAEETDALSVELDTLLARDNVHGATLRTRLVAYRDMRNKLLLYEDVLNVRVADMARRLERMDQQVRAVLGIASGITPAPSSADAAEMGVESDAVDPDSVAALMASGIWTR